MIGLHGYRDAAHAPARRLDDWDAGLLAERRAAYDAIPGPRVGDFVRFADGVTRRISHIWRLNDGTVGAPADSVQTSDGGSYYLGDGFVTMSGGLHPGVPAHTLTETDETRDGWIWFFHHGFPQAHNGVDWPIPFRVFTCTEEAPS